MPLSCPSHAPPMPLSCPSLNAFFYNKIYVFSICTAGRRKINIQCNWTAVEGGMDIPWDLEATPLQIKTNSTLGSDPIECPAFTVEGSTKGNWTTSPRGMITTIECAANHILEGSAKLTCQDDGSWSSDVPQCVEWTAVQRDNSIIPWDLESTPLQIKTDSTTGSDENIYLTLTGNNGNPISDIVVKFNSPAFVYQIYYCTGSQLTDLPPVEVDKTWTLSKTETAWIITCNGVEVLNYLFADSSESNCAAKWGGDVVEEIMFTRHDTASDFYRAGNWLSAISYWEEQVPAKSI
eukprot:sb/3467557/